MGENTAIEWCDHTFNPWIGCQKVGPGCDHCYAERDMDHRFGRVKWGPGQVRQRTSAANWKKPLAWNRAAERDGVRRKVFCASLGDWLDNAVPNQWREDLAALIEATPHLDWLLLSKRSGNFDKLAPWHADDIPANVWLGITVVNQEEADRDIPKLLAIPAVVRFLSCEPLLGPIELGFAEARDHPRHTCEEVGCWRALDWIICGGESGPDARPMHPAWARSLRDQCAAAGVPFFFKQWGEWVPRGRLQDLAPLPVDNRRTLIFNEQGNMRGRAGGSLTNHLCEFTDGSHCEVMERIGKKAAGALLDGREHKAFPEARP